MKNELSQVKKKENKQSMLSFLSEQICWKGVIYCVGFGAF